MKYTSKYRKLKLSSEQFDVQFTDHYFETNDEQVMEFIEKHPHYGIDFSSTMKKPVIEQVTVNGAPKIDTSKYVRYGVLHGKLYNDEGKLKQGITMEKHGELIAEYDSLKKELNV